MDLQDLQLIASEALGRGAEQKSMSLVEWNVAGNCTAPVARELHAVPPAPDGQKDVVIEPGKAHSLTLAMDVRCRKCDNCRKQRRNLWMARAIQEHRAAYRTWFGTLTLRPDEHHRFHSLAIARARKGGVVFEELSIGEQLVARHNVISPEITLMLKRIRKNSGVKLRCLVVMEAHKSGLPHYHLLIHESTPEPVRKSLLDKAWKLGFTNWKLCSGAQAAYVCKYLNKSSAARVRASLDYGNPPISLKLDSGLVEEHV